MAKASGKSKKMGRNKIAGQAYRSSGKREKNKKIKLIRHFKAGHANDKTCAAALLALKVKPESING
jgi:hypothetical protein